MTRRPVDETQLALFGDDAGADPTPSDPPAESPTAPPRAPTRTAAAGSRRFLDGPLPDGAARARIREDLDTNLLVEAGAGSGKTSALVRRMVELIRTGTAGVDGIAAVTFTRKAAAELRQRFQTELETAAAAARAGDPAEASRLDRAVRDVDRAFIGTIHSFCARLLRERPVEAGLDPRFRELMGPEEIRIRNAFWRSHVEALAGADDPLVAELSDVGLGPSRLRGLFDAVVENPDVEFPIDAVDPPDPVKVAGLRHRLDALIDRARAMMPADEPDRGWDEMQRRVRQLAFLRRVVAWNRTTDFLDTLGEEFHGRSFRVTMNRWPDGGAARELEADWRELRDGDGADLLDRWWSHRYPVAMRFALRAAREFEAERRATGRLNFQDLLMLTARLLREHPAARRELGERYRRLLVDEFQDTDPIQAEVLMLLASPPDERPWRDTVPRPGALFVVGDPKQSIYRFRRADIAVYNLVRDRFADFGAVVELVANFRSLPPIGALVDGVFGTGRFPEAATPYQAAFAPLRTRRMPEPGQMVARYDIDPAGRSHAAAAEDEAARIAPWIAGQIAEGRRRPEDFLILARLKSGLATYARTLEAWGVPVQVTGAGIDRSEEVEELLLLMDALADPGDPVRVVSVLVGLLFGIDHDALIAWALGEDLPEEERAGARRSFDITRDRAEDRTDVGRALHRLNGWWAESLKDPADALVGRIVDELGLVPLAAARELGELRAGSLLFAIDAIRTAALEGDTSMAAAADALRAALESDEAEAPLEPVRRGVARVMTLHQAKGLEAPVVVLAHPVGSKEREVVRHIERGADGSARGYLVIQEEERYRIRTIARPPDWDRRCQEERMFERAEQERLLYVAATRAGEALLVGRSGGDADRSPWAGLYPWIEEQGEILDLPARRAPPPERLEAAPTTLREAIRDVDSKREALGRPSYETRTPTVVAKGVDGAGWLGSAAAARSAADGQAQAGPSARDAPGSPEPGLSHRGVTWGSAVHGALDAAARGAAGEALERLCRSILLEEERPVEDGEPTELTELMALVERVLASAIWSRARSSDRFLSEAPFALRVPPEWGLDADVPQILEGVIDLAFREADGWVIVDYKTDVDAGIDARTRYRRQVELYARAWETLTSERVAERVLFYTARPAGRDLERW